MGLLAPAGLILGVSAQAPSTQAVPPRTILENGALLADLREHRDLTILRAARKAANKALGAKLVSVMDNHTTPPSGDKHDYMSLAAYWWPNPDTANHLPYVRRDGERNPETAAIQDHANISHMEENVHALALAYYLTDEEAYAERAAEQLRVWFLNPATRMNPNLKYAQAVLGANEGRGTGILDARGFADVVDAVFLLDGSNRWTAADRSGLRAWFETYFEWLTTSANGKHEDAATNNHGSWYDVQAEAIALYLGKTEFAHNLAEMARTKRIAAQIKPDGQQPAEEARTRSFHYCSFNLQALTRLATETQAVNVNLWDYKTPGGGSIRGALDYLLPFARKEKPWPFKDIDGVDSNALHDVLLMAAVHFHDPGYEALAKAMPGADTNTLLLQREFAEMEKMEK